MTNQKTSQTAGTECEAKKENAVNKMMFNVLEQKLDSLLLADKYHRILHTIYIFLLLVLILFR